MINKNNNFLLKVLEAVKLASVAHKAQKRRGTDLPYIIHPIRVAQKVAIANLPGGISVDLKAAILSAILHDVLEDSNIKPTLIKKKFGIRVLNTVKELTQDKNLPRKKRRVLMLEKCKSMSYEARLIKLIDREDNIVDMGSFPKKMQEAYCNETVKMLKNLSVVCPEIEEKIFRLINEFYNSGRKNSQRA